MDAARRKRAVVGGGGTVRGELLDNPGRNSLQVLELPVDKRHFGQAVQKR